MSKIEQVKAASVKILEGSPEGKRFKDLIKEVRDTGLDWEGLPQYIQWLPERNPELFYKPSRGIFALVPIAVDTSDVSAPVEPAGLQVEVQHFAEKMLHGQIVSAVEFGGAYRAPGAEG
jgi:hypothetical protein